jgi:hypothetical protein
MAADTDRLMLEQAMRRAVERAERRAKARREDLARVISEALPGVRTWVEDDEVVLSGRNLRLRSLTDPVLRWLGVRR